MNESNKYNENDRAVCYKYENDYLIMSMVFNKDIKTVDIHQSRFISNSEPMLEPMDSNTRHSCKYGHWQSELPTLGLEDIEFLYKKAKQLFVEGACNE